MAEKAARYSGMSDEEGEVPVDRSVKTRAAVGVLSLLILGLGACSAPRGDSPPPETHEASGPEIERRTEVGGPPRNESASREVLPLKATEGASSYRIVGNCQVHPWHLGCQQGSPWSPVDPLLAVELWDDPEGSLAIVDPDPWDVRIVGKPGETLPAWSPDGRTLAVIDAKGEDLEHNYPEAFDLRLIDACSGEAQAVVELKPSESGPPFYILRDAVWYGSDRWLISSHFGTAADTLWVLEDTDTGDLRFLTNMTLRFAPADGLVAFELWKAGGSRAGVVDLAGGVQWFDLDGVQLVSDTREEELLLTTWSRSTPGRSQVPGIVLWRPADEGQDASRPLKSSAGWGSWNHDGSVVAAIQMNARDRRERMTAELVVFDPGRREDLLRIPIGWPPLAKEEQYWKWHGDWFEARRPRWSPTENRLVFADEPGNLWLLDANETSLAPLLSGVVSTRNSLRTEWSPDGRFLAVFYSARSPEGVGNVTRMVVLEVAPE